MRIWVYDNKPSQCNFIIPWRNKLKFILSIMYSKCSETTTPYQTVSIHHDNWFRLKYNCIKCVCMYCVHRTLPNGGSCSVCIIVHHLNWASSLQSPKALILILNRAINENTKIYSTTSRKISKFSGHQTRSKCDYDFRTNEVLHSS